MFSVGEYYAGKVTWSPDSQKVAFLSYKRDVICQINILDLVTEKVTKVTDCTLAYYSLDWSSDGKYLLYSDKLNINTNQGIVTYNLESNAIKQITYSENNETVDDIAAIWLTDNKSIAFLRNRGVSNASIYITDLEGNAKALYSITGQVMGLTYMRDENAILYALVNNSKSSLWKYDLDDNTSKRINIQSDNVSTPTYSEKGKMIAFVQMPFAKRLMTLNLDSNTKKTRINYLFNSDSSESYPAYSNATKKLVYLSTKDSEELWLSTIDGDDKVRITNLGVDIYGPSWSPDGRYISFTASNIKIGFKQIHLYDTTDQSLKVLTDSPWEHAPPTWSADSKFIFTGQSKEGDFYLWKLDLEGNQESVINESSIYALQTMDGKRTFFTSQSVMGIWEINESGESSVLIVDLGRGDGSNWTVVEKGIYYLSRTTESDDIKFFDFQTNEASLVISLRPRTIAYTQNFSYIAETNQLIFVERSFSEIDIYSIDYP